MRTSFADRGIDETAAFAKSLSNLDRTGGVLLLGNVLLLFLASAYGWGFATIAWAYWCEGVLIGLFLFLKYLMIAKHEGKNTKRIGYFVAFLFAVHWSIFHLAEIVIITNIPLFQISSLFTPPPTMQFVVSLVMVFLIQAVVFFSKGYLRAMDENNHNELQKELKDTFMGPYSKIVPNQLAIVLMGIATVVSVLMPDVAAAGFAALALVPVMLFKTFGSAYMYIKEEAI